MNNALEPEQFEHLAKERDVMDIQPQTTVAKDAVDEEEITGARSKIENALRPHPIKADVLNTPNIHFEEALGLDVLGPLGSAGHTVGLLEPFQFGLIDLGYKPAERKWADSAGDRALGA